MPSLILIMLLFLLLLGFVFIEPIITKHKIINKNEYGSARFSSFAEIKNNFSKEKISQINEVGVPIYYSKNLKYVWLDKETPHYVYLGSSNSGKTVTSVIPMISFIAIAKKKRSVFITDPKGEIYEKTSKMLKDNGYNILTIDFRNPTLSNNLNLLEPIIFEYEKYIEYEKQVQKEENEKLKEKYNNLSITSYAEAIRLINSLATIIMTENNSKDPFWNNSSKNLLEGLISFFMEEYKKQSLNRNQITLTNIRKFQNSIMKESNFEKFKTYIENKEAGSKAKDNLLPILSINENTYKSITSVFSEKMSIFDDINVTNITSKSDFDFDILGKKITALYVIVPEEDKIYFKLVTLIIAMMYKELIKLANSSDNKKLPIEIDFLLDEFANCPPFDNIESMVSVARSRGIRFHFYIQSLAQLNSVYGKEISKIILDNSGLIYLKTNTMDTAEEISKRLGKKTIESNSISRNLNIFDNKGNKSTSFMARDLFTPDEVKNLYHKTIIFPNIGYPIFRDTVLYNNLSCYKKGTVNRKVRSLANLGTNYYTVENIKQSDTKNKTNNQNSDNEVLENFNSIEKKKLENAIEKINKIIKNNSISIEYKKVNMRNYTKLSLKEKLSPKEKSLIKRKLDNNLYHLIIEDYIIEIHLKTFFENTLKREKPV